MLTHPFALGAVIFPAADSLLAQLGVDIATRGLDCLGLVVEERSDKSRVYFPNLDLTVWLDHDEMKDLRAEGRDAHSPFAKLNPSASPSLAAHAAWQGHWWITELGPMEILETQTGRVQDLWSREDGPLAEYYPGDPTRAVFKLALAVEELDLNHWKRLEAARSADLALVRFLPAGMHKLEISLYLNRQIS